MRAIIILLQARLPADDVYDVALLAVKMTNIIIIITILKIARFAAGARLTPKAARRALSRPARRQLRHTEQMMPKKGV
jgi:hypothetical protein